MQFKDFEAIETYIESVDNIEALAVLHEMYLKYKHTKKQLKQVEDLIEEKTGNNNHRILDWHDRMSSEDQENYSNAWKTINKIKSKYVS